VSQRPGLNLNDSRRAFFVFEERRMENFIAENPGVAWALIGLLVSLIVAMAGLVSWLYRAKQAAEQKATSQVVSVLTEALEDLKKSLKDTANEVFMWVRGAESRISWLEAQHEQNHGYTKRKPNEYPKIYR